MTDDLTPNTRPDGERCGSCRFAGTHTHSIDQRTRGLVRCLRYPPQRLGRSSGVLLAQEQHDTRWPVLTWDDWCGEWRHRDPVPTPPREPIDDRYPARPTR